MKNILVVIGAIYLILIIISGILQVINIIKQRQNIKKFAKSINDSEELNKTFEKLTPDKIEELRKNKNYKEKTIDLEKENNYKAIMEKYKDYQVKDMNEFIDKLTKYLRSMTGDEKSIISDWFKIVMNDGSCIDKFTFEVHCKNIFVVFGRDSCNVGKIITNICGFSNVEDLDILLKDFYKCDKIVRETRQYE